MRFLIITIVVFLFSNITVAQGYKIKVSLDEAKNKEVYLAHYYLGNIYVDDTLKLDINGSGSFVGDTLLHQGLYKIYLDNNNHFDILIGEDQEFSISNPTLKSETVQVTEATETEEFIKYVAFLSELKKRGALLQEELKSAGEDQKKEIQEKLTNLTPELHNYWNRIKNMYPESFLSKFILSNYVPALETSDLPMEIQQNDSLLLLSRFEFQQKHFWDHFDYTDERFLYTPLLKPKLETWFTKVLYQNYDSIRPKVFEFIENVRPSKRLFQFVTSFFLNSSIKSNIMGMDALFVDLAIAYYLSGQAFWVTDESMEKIRENVIFLEHNLIGKTAPDLTLESVDGEFINLHQIDKKRTCVLIYEPNCSHCKEFVPKFYNDIYLKYKESGMEVFAIYSMDNKEEWVEFLDKHSMWDWINVWDKEHTSRFKVLYDARKTPGIYVLDENKKILSKKMSIDQLDQMMKHELN